ncbi:acyl-coenzyme A thioesterase THEM4-like [Bufo gargarizans]|uniref:acyl-coenzyme A thioesterase THEM4-like n=1 Tax=Bufo gargarizans TaxID=30331 RepID=UPI001CF26400|nr:acyl-coenzyme A thioesterase THEM4-like [Bufo gargarizans]
MLRGCGRFIHKAKVLCDLPIQLPGTTTSSYYFSVRRQCPTEELRDFALPNATWSQSLKDLYNKFMDLSKHGSWRRIPSHNTIAHHLEGDPLATGIDKRMFLRNLDDDGLGFEYCMFYNKDERRMVCLFQPGPYLEGPPGYAHGGCIATIIDSTAGAGAVYTCGSVMTANLNITYHKPIPLGCTLFVDSHVDRIERRKVYSSCQIQSHDGATLHAEATALFIKPNQ